MNTLSIEQKAAVVRGLVEGASIRAIARMTGRDKETVMKVLCDVWEFASIYQHNMLRALPCKRVEIDEIWSFVGGKQRRAKLAGQGDLWTYTAICADSKLAITWLVGPRSYESTNQFVGDLSTRLAQRVQLTTDGLSWYPVAIENAFGWARCDYAQLVKKYAAAETGRYSPPVCVGAEKVPVMGNPDPSKISTSYVERQNLNMRMQMRRFTRLTNGFSRKAENHAHAVSLHFMAYNYCRPHGTLTKTFKGRKVTPAMACELADHVWTIEEVLELMNPQRLLH